MQGLILIDKPSGMTSFSVVSRLKKLCNTKRVGHTGTLDPMATGVLPVFIGRPTVLCSYLLEADKAYKAKLVFGITTDTYDITGNIIKKNDVTVTCDMFKKAISGFLGEQMQLPPMYSAIKKNGVRLYDLARQGIEVERSPRKINIKSIDFLNFDGNSAEIEVLCSKGTYIRSLVYDIGEKLGCGAALSALRRIKTGDFYEKDCIALDKLDSDNIESYIISEENAVMHYPQVEVSLKQAVRFSNGGGLAFERLKKQVEPGGIVRIKYNGKFVGLGYADAEKSEITVRCCTDFINL